MSMGAAIGRAVFGALALAGCQSLDLDWMKERSGEEQAAAASDPAEMRMAEAMVRAQEAWTKLAEIRSAGTAPPVDIPRMVTPELQKRVTLDWLGPLESAAERLAEEIGYDFVVAGSRPPAPVMVEIDVEDEPVIFVLRDIGLQAEGRALLTTDAGRMVVRLDWIGTGSREEGTAASGQDGS